MGMGGVSKVLAAVVLGLALAVGYVVRYDWTPVLNLPFPLSAIVLSLIGRPGPPYLEHDAWARHEEWMKDGDVVIAAGFKSGTTWTLYCSHQIRVHGNDEKVPFEDIMHVTPWPDLRQVPGHTWDDTIAGHNTVVLPDGRPLKEVWDNEEYPFRIFKTHTTPRGSGGYLPVEEFERRNIKVVAITRNGLDVVASAIPFADKHTDEWRNMWGGIPPAGQDANATMENFLPGGIYGSLYFDYVNQWWPLRNRDNVLLLHYADMKRDLPGHVAKLAAFMGVELTDEEHAVVTEKCGFPHMKANTHKVMYDVPLNPTFKGTIMHNGGMTNRGQNGRGRALFGEDLQARWASFEEELLGHDQEMLQFARYGSQPPDKE